LSLVVAVAIVAPGAGFAVYAKVCTTSRFEESGALIGQTSNGVYLAGESLCEKSRRVATFTAAQTEEAFIGAAATEAIRIRARLESGSGGVPRRRSSALA